VWKLAIGGALVLPLLAATLPAWNVPAPWPKLMTSAVVADTSLAGPDRNPALVAWMATPDLSPQGSIESEFEGEFAEATVFEVYPCKGGTPVGGIRIGFQISSLDPTLRALRQQSVTIHTEPHDSPWGRRAVVEDPNGNRIELTEPG
jgi:catechol 2,3-dioxygenase-like lactoylglutathione lyase family enzyme